MSAGFEAESPPLRREKDGSIRVGNSRVLFDLVIEAFQDGAAPESIVSRYPTVALVDVYGAISYYLRHREEVEQYLDQREQQAGEVRKKIESRQGDLSERRARLHQRAAQRGL